MRAAEGQFLGRVFQDSMESVQLVARFESLILCFGVWGAAVELHHGVIHHHPGLPLHMVCAQGGHLLIFEFGPGQVDGGRLVLSKDGPWAFPHVKVFISLGPLITVSVQGGFQYVGMQGVFYPVLCDEAK